MLPSRKKPGAIFLRPLWIQPYCAAILGPAGPLFKN
jgi:hypothetical protein